MITDEQIQLAYEKWADSLPGKHAAITGFYAGYRAALNPSPLPQVVGIVTSKETMVEHAKDLLKKTGWTPGSNLSGHSAVQLMAEFGMRVQAGDVGCDYPNCGCCADAACGDAVNQHPGLGGTPKAHVVGTVACPCTLIEQDEDCPVGYPSLICGICEGKGHTTQEQVTALACEMIKIASDMGEPEDPFAVWESIDLLKSQNEKMRAKLASAEVRS